MPGPFVLVVCTVNDDSYQVFFFVLTQICLFFFYFCFYLFSGFVIYLFTHLNVVFYYFSLAGLYLLLLESFCVYRQARTVCRTFSTTKNFV